MGRKTILLLLVLALGLGAVLWFTDEQPPLAQRAEATVLDGRSMRQAVRIRWQFRERPAIEVGRSPDGRFQIKEPIVDIASAGYMTQIVNAWDSAGMRATPLVDDAKGRAEAGLEPPQLKLMVEFADHTRIDIDVGDPGPLGTTRFVRRDGKIWEAGEGLVESMQVGLKDLRERVVFRNAFAQSDEVRIDQVLPSGKREVLHLKLTGKDWRLLAPIEGRADPRAAQSFLTSVLSLNVSEFHPGVVRVPDEEPAIKVLVRGLHGEETVDLWEVQGQVYGRLPGRDNVTFTADNRQYSQIFVNAVENLRARILVPMGESLFEELVDLVIDPGQGRGDRVRLSRGSPAEEWRLIEPIEHATRPTPCTEAAYSLSRLVAKEFVTDDGGTRPRSQDPRYGLIDGRWSIVARRNGEPRPMTLWIGNDVQRGDETMVYVCRSDEPDNVALVPKEPLETLQRSWLDYCNRRVLQQNALIELVRLQRTGVAEPHSVFVLQDEDWVLRGSEGSRAEVGAFANDVLRDLVGTKAIDMRAGFGDPDWQIVIGRANGDTFGALQLWDRGHGARLIGKGPGNTEVGFELEAHVDKFLRELWK